jgi:hypothetical protein
MDVPPELLSLAWQVLDPSYQPPGPPPPTIHWTPNTAYALGSVLIEPSAASAPPGLFFKYVCTRAGTSDPTTEPLWPIVGSIIDAGCTWLAREYVPYAPAVARKGRPSHAEPPHVPTAAQLAVRAAFLEAVTAIKEQAPTEKHAWFRLTLNTGQEYWNYLAQWYIEAAYYWHETRTDWSLPRTRVSDPDQAASIPIIALDYPDRFAFQLMINAQLHPGTYRANSPTFYEACPYYVHDRCEFTPYGITDYGFIMNPKSNFARWYGFYQMPQHNSANTFFRRTITFKKQVQELDRECLVWQFEPRYNPENAPATLHAFWGPENPWHA